MNSNGGDAVRRGASGARSVHEAWGDKGPGEWTERLWLAKMRGELGVGIFTGDRLMAAAKSAREWVLATISAVRSSGPQWASASDEQIAKEIVTRMEMRK